MQDGLWAMWKRGFEQWEQATSQMLEGTLKSPFLLEPAGAFLTAAMRAKALTDEQVARWWALSGLSTRRDQERMLHAIHQLESRLHDLEDLIEDKLEAHQAAPAPEPAPPAPPTEKTKPKAGKQNAEQK